MLLMKASTYRAPDFMAAARRLGIEVIRVVDTPQALAVTRPNLLAVDFHDVAAASEAIVAFARERPVQAILSVDDSGSVLAAQASATLKLPHNRPQAAEAARDKHLMRSLLGPAGVPIPRFRRLTTADDVETIAREITFPCVVKPLRLSGSRGVIRADNTPQLRAAVARLAKLLDTLEATSGPHPFLVESYIPGKEVALEGILDAGRLHVLALFDKPDPLEGPYFEETIYVTPSRLPSATQKVIAACAADAARGLGLRAGPVHAELRLNEDGPWLLEIAGRSIGGLCARTLRFGVDSSLEELILRQATGMPLGPLQREAQARGVMMIPIPGEGLLKGYEGVTEAKAVPHVTAVEITAPLNHILTPLPEGESYLGFLFAQAETPAQVEEALRRAHGELHFEIEPVIPLVPASAA